MQKRTWTWLSRALIGSLAVSGLAGCRGAGCPRSHSTPPFFSSVFSPCFSLIPIPARFSPSSFLFPSLPLLFLFPFRFPPPGSAFSLPRLPTLFLPFFLFVFLSCACLLPRLWLPLSLFPLRWARALLPRFSRLSVGAAPSPPRVPFLFLSRLPPSFRPSSFSSSPRVLLLAARIRLGVASFVYFCFCVLPRCHRRGSSTGSRRRGLRAREHGSSCLDCLSRSMRDTC